MAPIAPASARFSDLAPCEPPKTSSTGRSARSPKCARALSPSANRSSSAICRLIGSPRYCALRSLVSGWPVNTYVVSRAPSRLAMPGDGFASCTTIGTLCRLAARYAGVATYPPKPTSTSARTRSSIAPAVCTAPASRPGTVSSCGVTERGSGTAGMSASS